ncbi:hypothetical protein ACP70R_014639 [Stipagrostis hirtigluma subsp. patula]
MAGILHSTIGKTVCRAFSLEGILPVHPSQPHQRLLHAGRTAKRTHRADASHGKPFLKPDEVDPLVQKIDDVARTAMMVEYTQSLVGEQKTKLVSPHLMGIALPWLLGMGCIGLYAAGYLVGFSQTTEEEHQAYEGKEVVG